MTLRHRYIEPDENTMATVVVRKEDEGSVEEPEPVVPPEKVDPVYPPPKNTTDPIDAKNQLISDANGDDFTIAFD